MEEKYTFERLWKELNDGYQIYYNYIGKRYMLTKLTKNCYSRQLLDTNEKSPHQKNAIVTLKSVKELFPFMEEIEYRVEN